MGQVDFNRIAVIAAGQASPVQTGTIALGPTTEPTRPTLYDPKWGYFLFGQSVACEYDDMSAYQDVATFTIEGTFTRDAEQIDDGTDDDTAFNAMMAKFLALEDLFTNNAKAAAPASYNLWGTSSDPRCIALPVPLLDHDGNTVYGLPVGIRITKTRVPQEIKYQAVLREAKMPPAKLMINDCLLDNGQVEIICPEPVFARHTIVGTSGEVLQLKFYKTMEVEVSGTLPLIEPDQAVSQASRDLSASIELGKLTVQIATPATTQLIWDSLDVVEEATVDADYMQEVMNIAVKARE